MDELVADHKTAPESNGAPVPATDAGPTIVSEPNIQKLSKLHDLEGNDRNVSGDY